MVPVSDYIKKLLYQYDCLVVPELGGFLLHYLPASYSDATETYLPPRKRVAFNEALKLDDGLLISYMVLHEGQTRDEVVQRIRSFVETLKQQIRTQGSFNLEGVGLFTANDENKLQFDPELRHNFLGEAYGFQPITVMTAPAELEMANEQELETADEVDSDQPLHPATLRPRRPYWGWAAAMLLVGSVGAMSYLTFTRVPGQLVSSLNPFDMVWTMRSLLDTPAKPVAKATPTPVKASESTAPAPIAATEPVFASAAVPAPTLPEKPVVVASAEQKAKVAEPEPVKAPVIAPELPALARYRYLAIAGSFSSKRNARKLMKQLRRHGYAEAIIVNPNAKKGLIKVAAFGFDKRSEVTEELAKVSQLTGVDTWVSKSVW